MAVSVGHPFAYMRRVESQVTIRNSQQPLFFQQDIHCGSNGLKCVVDMMLRVVL